MIVVHSAPKFASNEGVRDALVVALGDMVLASKEEHGEIVITVKRDAIEIALRLLRERGVLSGFSDEERRACKATLGRLVLSTDMAHHAKLLEEFVDAATNAMETAS